MRVKRLMYVFGPKSASKNFSVKSNFCCYIFCSFFFTARLWIWQLSFIFQNGIWRSQETWTFLWIEVSEIWKIWKITDHYSSQFFPRLPPVITSEGNSLRLEFNSDNSVQKTGFAAIFFTGIIYFQICLLSSTTDLGIFSWNAKEVNCFHEKIGEIYIFSRYIYVLFFFREIVNLSFSS